MRIVKVGLKAVKNQVRRCFFLKCNFDMCSTDGFFEILSEMFFFVMALVIRIRRLDWCVSIDLLFPVWSMYAIDCSFFVLGK